MKKKVMQLPKSKKAEGLTMSTIVVAVIVIVVLIVIVFIFTRQMADRNTDLNSCRGNGGICMADNPGCSPGTFPAISNFDCTGSQVCCLGNAAT